MKLYAYVFFHVLFWSLAGVMLFCVFIPWKDFTWFDLLLVIGYPTALAYYFWHLLRCIAFGEVITKTLVLVDLPEKKAVSFSLCGYDRAKFVIFSPSSNLLKLKGIISLQNGDGKIVEQLLLNQSCSSADSSNNVKSIRVSAGGKGARMDCLLFLSLDDVDQTADAKLNFDLDWNSSKQIPASNSLTFEVIVRGRKATYKHQPSILKHC
jgi:hypothetical protein